MRDHPSVFGQITSESKEITNLIFKQDSTDVRCEVASIRGYRKVEVANFTTGTLEILSEAYKVENYYNSSVSSIFDRSFITHDFRNFDEKGPGSI